jgi:putative drug exporter of the RND superfamily
MATLLYRLGRASFRRRRLVVVIWLVLLAAVGASALVFKGPTANGFTMPGTESQRAVDALKREFPQASGATGTIVVAAPAGRTLAQPALTAAVQGLVKQASAVPGVVGAVDPFTAKALSRDGRYGLITVQFTRPVDQITAAQRTAFENTTAPGLRVEHGGEVLSGAPPQVGGTEGIGVAVALVVLLITFGSLVAAGMTMLNALIGVGAGIAGLYALSSVVSLTSATPVLALMLGLAVGIDYSLFITSRHRSHLADGLEPEEAVGRATGTAGSAVLFAGLTVIIALAGLSVVGIPFLTVMGLAAAGTVAVAVLVALTLLPALIGFAGAKVLPRKLRTGARHQVPAEGFGFRWARLVRRFRIPVIVAGLLGLGVLALPATGLRLALPDPSAAAEGTPAREAADLISEGFGPGFNGRLVMVVSSASPDRTAGAVQQVPTVLAGTPHLLAVTAPNFSQDKRTALLQIIPQDGPTTAATESLVRDVRARTHDLNGADVALTGQTALGIDVSQQLADALPIYLILVVGLSVLLLMVVFRSILVPLKAAAGFLLTVGATFGVTVFVFQDGHLASGVGVDTAAPLVSFLPVLLVGILFGLAMDYEVFLVSRMREDFVHGETAQEAMVSGMGHGARVVTAAALIMISVFAGFVLIDDPIIKSVGFALAVGVAVDAFVVRMTIVPAVISLLGRSAWWLPGWLNRILPDVDVEGEKLRRRLDVADAPVPEPEPATR